MQLLSLLPTIFLLWQTGTRAVNRNGGNSLNICLTAGFVGLVVLAVVAWVIFSYFRQKKRLQALRDFAARNGWDYAEKADVSGFPNSENYFVFGGGDSYSREIRGLIQKAFQNERIFVFDYSYSTGRGKNRKQHKMTVFTTYSPNLNLPFFGLFPRSFFSFVGEIAGYNDIQFPQYQNFSKNYKLTGRDEAYIRQIFQPQVLSRFDGAPPALSVDGGGHYLFVYTQDQTVPVENLDSFVNQGTQIVGLFLRR